MDATVSNGSPAKSRDARAVPAPTAQPKSAPDRVVPLPARRAAETSSVNGRNGDVLHADSFDRWLHSNLSRFTRAISPAALLLAYVDWIAHLGLSPAKQAELARKAWRKAYRLALYLPRSFDKDAPWCIEPLAQDRRFSHPDWRSFPFNVIAQSFLLQQQWWYNATSEIRGVSKHHEDIAVFVARQLLDIVSPSNFLWTNPQRARQDVRVARAQPVVRLAELARRVRAHPGGTATGGRGRLPAGRDRRADAGPGRVPQPADRADPVRADDADGTRRAGADRAGVDHEVLHPRPVAVELADPAPGRPRPHGVLHLVEEPGRERPRPRHGGLPAHGHRRRARGRERDLRPAGRARGRLLPRRHAARDRGGGDGARRRHAALRASRCSPRRPTSASRASSGSSSRRAR